MSPQGKRLSASEIGRYTYCARAWWYETVKKLTPLNVEALEQGAEAHERHGWQVAWAQGMNWLALALLGVGVLLMVVWLMTR